MFRRSVWFAAWMMTSMVFCLAVWFLPYVVAMLAVFIVTRWMLYAIGGSALVLEALRPLHWLKPWMAASSTWLTNPPPVRSKAKASKTPTPSKKSDDPSI